MRKGIFAAAALNAAWLGAGAALPASAAPDMPQAPAAAAADAAKQAAAQAALAEVQRTIKLSDSRRAALKAETEALKKDEQSLSRAYAAAAKSERAYAASLAAGAMRLADLTARARAQQQILEERRANMAEILAALEKLGYNSPPPVLVRANDAAQALRAAVLLGALLPQMQEKMQQVRSALDELSALQKQMEDEQRRLAGAKLKQKEEQLRLSLLLAAKAQLQSEKQRSLAAEEENRKNLEAKAHSLQDLLEEIGREPPAPAGQLEIAAKFSSLRGQLERPAAGRELIRFGQREDGKTAQGESIITAPGAEVFAPAEGVVRYAGKFRSYGNVLILDVGENYYIVLAGLAQIYAGGGQFVLRGEPVGKMAAALPAGEGGFARGAAMPRLYTEIRKGGKPINPTLWWAPAGKSG